MPTHEQKILAKRQLIATYGGKSLGDAKANRALTILSKLSPKAPIATAVQGSTGTSPTLNYSDVLSGPGSPNISVSGGTSKTIASAGWITYAVYGAIIWYIWKGGK